jgi:alpha-glucosidase
MGLSGWAFTGPDIGGFIGDGPRGDSPEETARLRGEHFARWMGIGALMPFSRGHTAKGNIDKEPWAFNKDTENATRIALQRRYALMPYLYTLFYEASTNGMPVARPVFFADPKDPALRSEDDAFLLGADIMVVPQLMPDGTRTPVLPKGIWRPFDVVGDRHPANPDLLIRGGAIVPSGPVLQSVALPTDNAEPRTLYVSLDDSGQARGAVYEDAQDGFGYQKGDFLLTLYTARIAGDEVIVSVGGTQGDRARPARDLIVRVVTDEGIREARGKDGGEIRVRLR